MHSSRRLGFLFLDSFTVLRDMPTSATLLGLYIIFLLSLLSRCLRGGTLPEGLLGLKAYSWEGLCVHTDFVISFEELCHRAEYLTQIIFSKCARSAIEPAIFRYQLSIVKYWISLLYTVIHLMHPHLQRPRSVRI